MMEFVSQALTARGNYSRVELSKEGVFYRGEDVRVEEQDLLNMAEFGGLWREAWGGVPDEHSAAARIGRGEAGPQSGERAFYQI